MWRGEAVVLVLLVAWGIVGHASVADDQVVRWFRCIESSSPSLRPSPPNGGPIRLLAVA